MRFLLVLIFIIGLYPAALAVTLPPDSVNKPKLPLIRDKTLVPVPVVFRLPETGWGGGAVVASTFSLSRDSILSKPSQVSFGLTFTQRKQILVFMPFSVFYNNNQYYFNGETGWYKYNYNYFGIGENRVTPELYDVTYPRVRLLAAKQVWKNIYLGFRYHYESYRVTGTVAEGELASGRISGSDFSRSSGLGLSFLRDTRDSVFYPKKGVFSEFYILPTLRLLGSDRNFSRIYLDFAHYQSLGSKVVLAGNYVASSLIGAEIPFSQLSAMGGPRKMRGVLERYFQDKNTLLTQAEARWEVYKSVGLVGFGALGFMGNEKDLLRLQHPKFTYGFGLRYKVQKKSHLNIRLDYGMSPYGPGNIYATVGEAF